MMEFNWPQGKFPTDHNTADRGVRDPEWEILISTGQDGIRGCEILQPPI
jgi:hypothetical protein